MKKSYLFLLLLLLQSIVFFAQKKEVIYYDLFWGVCDKSEAEYYRIVTFDAYNKPIGMVKDYYITGELQFEGEAISIDVADDSNSKWKGKTVGFYQNGKRQFENFYDSYGNATGLTKNWDENGVMTAFFDFDHEDLYTLQMANNQNDIAYLSALDDETLLDEGSKIVRSEDELVRIYTFYDAKDDEFLQVVHSNNDGFLSVELYINHLSDVLQMETELKQKGFVKMQQKVADRYTFDSNEPQIIETWVHPEYPNCFLLENTNCENYCIISMYANTVFIN